MVAVAAMMFVALIAWGKSYFGWSDPSGDVQLALFASFTLGIAAGASPIEAAMLSNHAAGVVVGKVGTATVTPEELLASFRA